ncbi:MAG TPA: helix-turn-helix domain-containing protein [Burkholderiaceae bacterium]|nr:helix-turn-helix domain-containing protein [Burkholderiaceae bacterium]
MTDNPRNPPPPRRVEIVAFAQVQLLDVSGPLQVFASANDHAAASGSAPPYRPLVVAATSPVVTSSGVALLAAPLPRANVPVDTLLVAGGDRAVAQAARDAALLRWLCARASTARRFGSVCSGAFVLGAAGLLDGKRVATHWQVCDELARRYPRVHVEPDPIFVRDGALWTSAGVTAGIDMALAMVEDDLGHAAAIAVARDLVVFLKRPGSQAQFSTALATQHAGGAFEQLHAWIAGHLASDLSVAALAERAGMSERSFVRHFRAATGHTPADAVQRLRVEAARQLLATTALPIKRVAQRCGFGSEETMRRTLLRHASTTPAAYRARFSARAKR